MNSPAILLGARTTLTDKATAMLAGAIALDKLAEDVIVLEVSALTTVANYLVIASGESVRQVKAIAEAVDEALDAEGVRLLRCEGMEHGRWVLLDYGDIVVHVFHREAREFYRIERLWPDAPVIPIPESRASSRAARPSPSDRKRLVMPPEPG